MLYSLRGFIEIWTLNSGSIWSVSTVVWNDYLLIVWPKCNILHYVIVKNTVKIIKHVDILRFRPILKLLVSFVSSLFTFKPLIGDFYKFRFVTKWGCYSYFKLLIMLEYLLCSLTCAESDKWNFVDSKCFICIIVFSCRQ